MADSFLMTCYPHQTWGQVIFREIKNHLFYLGYGNSNICKPCQRKREKQEIKEKWTRKCVVCGSDYNLYYIRKTLFSGRNDLRPMVCTDAKCHRRISNAFSFNSFKGLTRTNLFFTMNAAHLFKNYEKAGVAFAIGELLYHADEHRRKNGTNRTRVKKRTV